MKPITLHEIHLAARARWAQVINATAAADSVQLVLQLEGTGKICSVPEMPYESVPRMLDHIADSRKEGGHL